MSVVTILVDAVLFDMDGTLIDSTPGVLQAWKDFAFDYNLKDSNAVAHASHGRRLYDTLKEYCGITDESRLLEEIDRFEDQVIQGGPIALPGAIDLVSKLSSHPSTKSKWTIVTSASNKFAPRALQRSGIPFPPSGIIASNDVLQGKPHPAPYLAGALRCGADPKKCIVIEDAISGLYSGRAAGSLTLAVCTSTPRATIADSGANPDYIVADLTKVNINVVDGNLEITIDQRP
jgi:HAD superfamily hydrolase (TIGR01509 family)